MTDKLRAAAQAAYKAMIAAELSDGSKREWEAAVDGLRVALAEPAIKESLTVAEQEPAAFVNLESLKDISRNPDTIGASRYKTTFRNYPLYTAPQKREWVGLTDEEIADIANSCRWSNTYHADFVRAIEAKLREKNT